MNKEIKEILDELESVFEISEAPEHIINGFNKIKDYITNLQEENERLKEECKKWKENHKAVCIQRDNILDNIVKDTERRIDYKSRCEKLELENKVLKEQMVAMVQPNYVYGIELQGVGKDE